MKSLRRIIFLLLLTSVFELNAQNAFEVKVEGKGQPILFFPGFTCTGEVWQETVIELAKNCECHIFTFAGFGNVPSIEKPWLPKIKEEIVQYVKEHKLENPIVIGHSMGGALGLWLATDEDHPYSKLIIVDALPSVGALMMPNFKSENMVYDSPWNKQTLEMNDEAFEKMAAQMAAGMTLNKEKIEQIKNWIIQSDRETYVYGYTDLLKLDLRKDIAKITIPVTVLGATHPFGLEMAKQTYETQYANLKDYKMEFAEGAAHFIMYDQPEWFLSKVQKALK